MVIHMSLITHCTWCAGSHLKTWECAEACKSLQSRPGSPGQRLHLTHACASHRCTGIDRDSCVLQHLAQRDSLCCPGKILRCQPQPLLERSPLSPPKQRIRHLQPFTPPQPRTRPPKQRFRQPQPRIHLPMKKPCVSLTPCPGWAAAGRPWAAAGWPLIILRPSIVFFHSSLISLPLFLLS